MRLRESDSIAHALLDAGVRVATHVPGHGGTQVFEALCELSDGVIPISFHEEVAYGIAHGASLVGKRSVVIIKSHGVAKAANAMLDSLSSGVTAGLLTLVFDDEQAKSSDSIFDVEALLRGIGLPYRRVSGEHGRDVREALEASERMRLPHALVIDAHQTEAYTKYSPPGVTEGTSPEYSRDVAQHFVGPLFAGYQHQVFLAKQRGEQWVDIKRPALPVVPDSLPGQWAARVEKYLPLFEVFRNIRGGIVTGDTSTSSFFALPPYNCVDVVTYMGGSIPLAVGAHVAGQGPVWALTGDFSFIAAGHLGLLEVVQRNIPLKVMIFANGIAEATGGQPIPEHLLEVLLGGYDRFTRHIRDSRDHEKLRAVIGDANEAEEMRIVVVHYGSS